MNPYCLNLLILCLTWIPLFAQQTPDRNLVINPSFEELRLEGSALVNKSVKESIVGWEEVALGDIFFVHTNKPYWKPLKNPWGSQSPHSGDGYMCFKVGGFTIGGYHSFYGDVHRFYLQTKLKEPLKAGLTYLVEYYVSFAEKSNLAIENLDACFLESPVLAATSDTSNRIIYSPKYSSSGEYMDFLWPQVGVKNPNGIIDNTLEWVKIQGEYTAKGGEQFLLIGNFKWRAFEYKFFKRSSHFPESFYYIDDVMVLPPPYDEYLDSSDVVVEKPFLSISDVGFAFGKSDLIGKLPQLDSLSLMMKEDTSLLVTIMGHTDSLGFSGSNIALSLARAESVKTYLIQRGVSPSKLLTEGYGSTSPLAPNTTVEGRRRNRRVEVWLHKGK